VIVLSNELIKHDAELNTIPLRKFTPTEMNLFFSIVSRMRDKDSQKVRFSFEQLRDLSNYKATANTRFIDDLERTYDHLMELKFGRRSKSGLHRERFVMFTYFDINGDVEEPYVDIQIHEKALPLLNHLDSWVRYSLSEFRDLNSSYAKTMFRLLKQYRTTGFASFSKDDFNELLDIPKSYRQSNIDQFVLRPIREELSPLFAGLKVIKRHGKGRGRPVIGYNFTWKQEAKNANDFSEGAYIDRSRKLENIKHNNELTHSEKVAATQRVIGRDASIDDLPDHINPTLETKTQKAERKAINDAKRSKVALDIARLEAKGTAMSASEKDVLTRLRTQYTKFVEQDN
jgi:plasmid replication initiation protein